MAKLPRSSATRPPATVPTFRGEIFDSLLEQVKPLLQHWVDCEWVMTKEEAEASIGDTSYFM